MAEKVMSIDGVEELVKEILHLTRQRDEYKSDLGIAATEIRSLSAIAEAAERQLGLFFAEADTEIRRKSGEIADLERQIAAMREAIEKAEHGTGCWFTCANLPWGLRKCDCWKFRALAAFSALTLRT